MNEAFAVRPTPYDGPRPGVTPPWDESTRPRWARPEDGRRFSNVEEATAHHLVEVHDHLRAELRQVQGLVEQVAAGSVDVGSARSMINTMTMRQNNWTLGAYCTTYCRLVTTHHTLEDVSVFPHLGRREPSLAPVLDRLEAEHEVIAAVLEDVDRALVALVSVDDGLDVLREALAVLTDSLLSHLSYEEHELLEPLARHGFY